MLHTCRERGVDKLLAVPDLTVVAVFPGVGDREYTMDAIHCRGEARRVVEVTTDHVDAKFRH